MSAQMRSSMVDFAPGMGTRDYLMGLLLELRDTRGKNLGRAEMAK